MDNEKHYRFTNWEKYQARNDKRMPWVKLWRNVLLSKIWGKMSSGERLVFVVCMCLADQDGCLPGIKSVVRACEVRTKTVIDALSKMNNFGVLEEILSDAQDNINIKKKKKKLYLAPPPSQSDVQTQSDDDSQTEKIYPPEIHPPLSTKKLKLPRPSNDPPVDIKEIWNALTHKLQAKCSVMNEGRKMLWRARWEEKPDEQYWRDVVTAISKAEWTYRGYGGMPTWCVGIDWLLEDPNRHVKISELGATEKIYENEFSTSSTSDYSGELI